MRTRQVHPDFWKSDSMAELSLFGRLLFIAMWSMADRDGLLLYRPKRILVEAFPYDGFRADKVDSAVERMKLLGMVRQIAAEGQDKTCLEIVNFAEYQSIHPKEAKSKLKDIYFPANSIELNVITGNPGEFPPASTSTSTSTSDIMSSSPRAANLDDVVESQVTEVIENFKTVTGKDRVSTKSPANRKHVRARIKEGASVDDLKSVANLKTRQVQSGDFKDQYLRIETLYNETKCQSYLAELDAIRAGTASAPHTLDYAMRCDLEFQLAENGHDGALRWVGGQKKELQQPLLKILSDITNTTEAAN